MTDNGTARRVNGPAARAIRLDRGFGLRFVASEARIDYTYLSRLERGIKGTRGVDQDKLQRLADVLGVPVDVLVSVNGAATEKASA